MSDPKPSKRDQKQPRTYSKHGLYQAKAVIKAYGSRAIDGRTSVGKALEAWKRQYINDLGGEAALSTAQRTLIDEAATTCLLLQSLNAWIVQQPSIVNKKRRALLPVVLQRQTLVDSLARLLNQLGLERKPKPVQSLQDFIRDHEAKKVEQP